MGELRQAYDLVSTAVWIVLPLIVAAGVFIRFRFTLSGLLIGGGFALTGLKTAVMIIVNRLVLSGVGYQETRRTMVILGSNVLGFLLLLVIAAGIFLIPSSLEQLSRRRRNEPPSASP